MKLKYCINCGMKLQENARYCPRCGASIEAMKRILENRNSQQINNTSQQPMPSSQQTAPKKPMPSSQQTAPKNQISATPYPYGLQQTTQQAQLKSTRLNEKQGLSPILTKNELKGITWFTLSLWGGHVFRYIFFQDKLPSLAYLIVNLILTTLLVIGLMMVYMNSVHQYNNRSRLLFLKNDLITTLAITTFALGYFPDAFRVTQKKTLNDKAKAKVYINLGYFSLGLSIFISLTIFLKGDLILSMMYGESMYVSLKDIILTASGIVLLFFIPSPISLPEDVSKQFGIRQTIFIGASILFVVNALSSVTLSYLSQLI